MLWHHFLFTATWIRPPAGFRESKRSDCVCGFTTEVTAGGLFHGGVRRARRKPGSEAFQYKSTGLALSTMSDVDWCNEDNFRRNVNFVICSLRVSGLLSPFKIKLKTLTCSAVYPSSLLYQPQRRLLSLQENETRWNFTCVVQKAKYILKKINIISFQKSWPACWR